MLALRNDRPPPPAQPVWTSLELTLDYPAYTHRAPRRVPNPSGSLRVPAGTVLHFDMEASQAAEAVRVVLIYDARELAAAPPPEIVDLVPDADADADADETEDGGPSRNPRKPGSRWRGSVTVRGSGTWIVVLLDDADTSADPQGLLVAQHRSAPMRLEIEADAPPQVELLPLPQWQREASETDSIDLRFTAKDDFGVVEAELVYEYGPDDDRQQARLSAGDAPGSGIQNWRHRISWDLAAIPFDDRGEVSYWVEVRDNDPGLGLVPLVDGPGKVAASAHQPLVIHDEEAEHADNIADLQTIRDTAVDLLAERLTTEAFTALDDPDDLPGKLSDARGLADASAGLLTMLASAVDALAMDTMVAERDVEMLAGIHSRLLELYREESERLEDAPDRLRLGASKAERDTFNRAAKTALRKLGKHNQRALSQLEDEVIRLDDLVDGQIIARVETLTARLQVSQQKLVEKLEQLAAGDESVRPQIEQLEQRIREDMRRLQEARAQLRKEVGDAWMNVDAFKAMAARMKSQALLEQLRRGDIEGALEQAREGLEAIREMRDSFQKSASEAEVPALSKEDRDRMKMLRELSRLQDEQTGLRGETQRLRERWREEVSGQRTDSAQTERAKTRAKKLREALEDINDANLSREGRGAWDDAREALQALEVATEDDAGEAGALALFEAARQAAAALERAGAGAAEDSAERSRLDALARDAAQMSGALREPLPDASEVLSPEEGARFEALDKRQQTLRERAERLLDDPAAAVLPEPGQAGMRAADQGMRDARDALGEAALERAIGGEQRAWRGIQRAIDSLRDSAPPPASASGGESSTEAERDRSLRDQVVEAMREGDRDSFDDDTKRYYEALLR